VPDIIRRLCGLSSTYTDYRLAGEPGFSLLIGDPVLAMRWYFTHEREEGLAVEGRVSDDNGVTWRLLPVRELFADAERALPSARHAGLLRDALADDAADWLDVRIRFVPPDDPTQWRPGVPGLDAWWRGGEIWALEMNAVPNEALITRLADQYTNPLPEGEGVALPEGEGAGLAEDSEPHGEGTDALREGSREMLATLALAEAPGTAAVHDLLAAFRPVEMLSYASAIGQLRDRVDQAMERLLNHLVTRVPETADAVAAHPDPGHPVHRAARIYLRRLAHAGDGSGRQQDLLARARQALADAVAAPEIVPVADDVAAVEPAASAVWGFPRQVTDLQAAAAWRTMSPLASQDAERSMADLVRAEDWLLQAAAEAGSWVEGRPRDPERARAFDRLSPGLQRLEARHARTGEADARENCTYFRQWLQELDARHALLMHATVLADARAAAATAKQQTVIAASTLAQTSAETAPPRTAGEVWAKHEAFMAQVTAAEKRIDQTLEVQRQATRDAPPAPTRRWVRRPAPLRTWSGG
jgi:hypothetical protein